MVAVNKISKLYKILILSTHIFTTKVNILQDDLFNSVFVYFVSLFWWGCFDRKKKILLNKRINFWGDLTGIAAKTATLLIDVSAET